MPTLLHYRKSIRIPGYDYSQPGAYFVTICTWRKQPLFGSIVNGEMHENEIGCIAKEEWNRLPSQFPTIELGTFGLMPDHIHAIIILTDPNPVGAPLAGAHGQGRALPLPSLGNIVGAYKSLVTNTILKTYKSHGQIIAHLWQRNYYEHIIRDQGDWEAIHAYIEGNPSFASDDL